MLIIRKSFVFLCGILAVFLFLEAGLRGWGLLRKKSAQRRETAALSRSGTYNILCLGESTTWNQYPKRLERILRKSLSGTEVNVFDGALAGINSDFILGKLEADLDRYKPDLVTVMMGCNDGEEVLDYGDVGSKTELEWMFRLRVFGLFRLLWWNLEQKRRARDGEEFSGDGGFENTAQATDEPEPAAEPEGDIDERIHFYENRIKADPENSENYFRLGLVMIDKGEIDNAYKFLLKARNFNPTDAQIYGSLATTCPPDEMAHWVNLALEIEPEHGIEPTGTIGALMYLERFDEALYYLKKVVSYNPGEIICFVRLGIIYMKKKEYAEAQKWLEAGLKHHPGDRQLLRSLSLVYQMQGKELNVDLGGVAEPEEGNSVLYENYNRLARMLEERGIRLVAVQYPVQSIKPLKKILSAHDDVLFVSNETSFKNAVKQEGYFSYFVDSFGGNFGHCTDKGNELVALNIARVILRDVFGHSGETAG